MCGSTTHQASSLTAPRSHKTPSWLQAIVLDMSGQALTRWEYQIIESSKAVLSTPAFEEFLVDGVSEVDALNAAGREGWEVCASSSSSRHRSFVLKRQSVQ